MFKYSRELSKVIATKYSELVESNRCYDNVYRVVTGNVAELNSKEIKVLFCYRTGEAGRYYRHVFVVAGGALVEPMLDLDMSELNRTKIITVQLLELHQYISYVNSCGDVALRTLLHDYDIKAVEDNDIINILGGIDLAKLYQNQADQDGATLLDMLKANLPDGVKVINEKEMTSKFKFVFCFEGHSVNGEIEKTVALGCEKSSVVRSIATCMSTIYLMQHNVEKCERWLEIAKRGSL